MNSITHDGPYQHQLRADGRVRFASQHHVFIRFRGRWEFYILDRNSEDAGLEQFVCYVTRAEHVAILEQAARAIELAEATARRDVRGFEMNR